jgi:hypothetical protein
LKGHGFSGLLKDSQECHPEVARVCAIEGSAFIALQILCHFLPFWYLNHALQQALLDFSFAASTNDHRYS